MIEEAYWNSFYSQSIMENKLLPSQFSVFFLNEIGCDKFNIIDIGCGNGRDSFMFANFHNVIGVDSSIEAINFCSNRGVNNTKFISLSIDDVKLSNQIKKIISESDSSNNVIYSRFFLHAINEESQAKFLNLARGLLKEGELLFLEFRTDKDKFQKKMTQNHYRRFINPLRLMEEAMAIDFKVTYFIEGYGFAKYKEDDAYVARVILQAI